jgi:predicted nucleic acid-binding protein
MRGRSFLDTKVILYADDDDHPEKRATARALIKGLATKGRAVVSTQVMAEHFAAATRKLEVPVEDARSLALWRKLPTVRPSTSIASINFPSGMP